MVCYFERATLRKKGGVWFVQCFQGHVGSEEIRFDGELDNLSSKQDFLARARRIFSAIALTHDGQLTRRDIFSYQEFSD